MRLLNGLVTNEYAIRLSHALSEPLNRLSALLPPGRRRREDNRAAVARYAEPGAINGQGRAPVAALPFGRYTMDYNGCEVIASYNALLTLGAPKPLEEVAAYYEGHGLFLEGLWGTHVAAIPRYFAWLGYAPRTLYASSVRAPADYDAAFATARAGVFSFWNEARRLRGGVHTVSLAHGDGGGLVAYNFYPLHSLPCTAYQSLAELIEKTGILPIVLVTL